MITKTVAELAEHFGRSERTIRRYLVGIPAAYTYRGVNYYPLAAVTQAERDTHKRHQTTILGRFTAA